MDRNLALEFVRVTEAAAIAAAKWVGRGDGQAADQAAVDAMRARFNLIDFSGMVVIGEGEKDKAPKLFTGEKVGKSNTPEMDLAIDPLECTDSVAWGRYDAIAVIAAGSVGSLLHAPDTYMDQITVGPEAAKVIDINAPPKNNLKKIAKAKGKEISEITVAILDRPRHEKMIKEIRAVGAKVRLITDGTVSGAIATCQPDSGVDVLMGVCGSTEAVLGAVPIRIYGGETLCQFKPRDKEDEKSIKDHLVKSNINDIQQVFKASDLAKGDQLTFTATGVIEGLILDGVIFNKDNIVTNSVVMRHKTKTIRYITTYNKID